MHSLLAHFNPLCHNVLMLLNGVDNRRCQCWLINSTNATAVLTKRCLCVWVSEWVYWTWGGGPLRFDYEPQRAEYLEEEEPLRWWSNDTVTQPRGQKLTQTLWCRYLRLQRHTHTHIGAHARTRQNTLTYTHRVMVPLQTPHSLFNMDLKRLATGASTSPGAVLFQLWAKKIFNC